MRTLGLRQWGSILLGVVEHKRPTPVPRENIHTTESRPTQTDCSPLLRHPDRRTPQMLEDTRTGVPMKGAKEKFTVTSK